MEQHAAESRVVFTIGHSNHSVEAFVDLLRRHQIEVVADVRSAPYSRYVPQFDQPVLRNVLQARGLRYLYFGQELGGRPEGEEFYDAAGFVRYDQLAQSPGFQAGLARLAAGIAQSRIALLCSEEDPAVCHRTLLVGRVLAERGFIVRHIRGDGRVQSDAELAPIESEPLLFDIQEARPWRSLQSVSPRNPPRSSSGP